MKIAHLQLAIAGCCLCAPIRETKEMLFDANYRAFALQTDFSSKLRQVARFSLPKC
jgi:hypothetical protein